MAVLLETNKISKSFPGVKALDEVDFQVEQGEVHALIGENGAGKSTLIKVVAGVHSFDGKLKFDGREVKFKDAKEAIDAGIRVIYQELNLCDSISVAENIFMGRLPKNGGIINRKKLVDDAKAAMSDIGLDIDPKAIVGSLPTAQQQMVEITKAVSGHAKLIIMDEPTSSLGNREIEKLFDIIETLKSRGISIIYVSHKLEEIFRIADRVTVMRDGRVVSTSKVSDVTQQDLVFMMIGRKLTTIYSRTPDKPGDVVLEARNIETVKLKDVSFNVRAGEIVGFSGLVGAGRTELARAVYGFDGIKRGTVLINGKKVAPDKTFVSKKMGMGFVSEDRKNEGIFPDLTVKRNISVTILGDLKKGVIVHRRSETERVREIVDRIRVKTPSLEVSPAKLSGGNQQKVILARWLMVRDIKVLIVDEPTRGIDVGAKSEIYAILDELAKQGIAIVIMSSEMNEILNVCDRIYVMCEGRITAEFSKEEATQELLFKNSISI